MPNPQQPELARARRSAKVSDDALPAKAERRSKKGQPDAPGPIPEDNAPGHQPDVVPDKPLVPPDPYRVHDAGAEPESRPPEQVGTSVTFPFHFDRLLLPAAAVFGITPMTASVTVDDDEVAVRFGPWSLRTPRSNVVGAEVTGPYRAIKIAGPPHLSLKDRGVTFATTTRGGTCIRFHDPVPALLPRGLVRHPAATVTVANPAALARRLEQDD